MRRCWRWPVAALATLWLLYVPVAESQVADLDRPIDLVIDRYWSM